MPDNNQADEFNMPLQGRRLPEGFPNRVLIPIECNASAKRNHCDQTLADLASRGGLSPAEAVAIMEDRPWHKMDVIELVDAFRKYNWI